MRCPLCGGPWGSCSCLSDIYGPGNGNENSGDDDYNGPSGGGNGTGGGNSGNHNGSEGNGSGNGNIVITSPNQKPVKDITQAASDAVDKVLKDHNNDRKPPTAMKESEMHFIIYSNPKNCIICVPTIW